VTLLDDIAAHIATNSTLFTVGANGNLTKAVMLDGSPDTVCTLYEQQGVFSVQAFSSSTGTAAVVWERPNLQLLSRSTSYQTARTRAETVYRLLDGLGDVTMSGTRYVAIDAVAPPFSAGRDQNQRFLVSVNFNVQKEPG
jgi:hypothetical protein